MTAAHAHATANLHALIAQAKQIGEQNQDMAAATIEEPPDNVEPPQDQDGGVVWLQLEENNSWATLTNFEKHDMLLIYELMQPCLSF